MIAGGTSVQATGYRSPAHCAWMHLSALHGCAGPLATCPIERTNSLSRLREKTSRTRSWMLWWRKSPTLAAVCASCCSRSNRFNTVIHGSRRIQSMRRQSKCGPRIRRIGPRAVARSTVRPCWVMRTRPLPAASAATARTCGIKARHTATSSLSARATSEGQMECCGSRCASSCRMTATICASAGRCALTTRAYSGRSRRRPNQSLASFQPWVTLSPAAAASSAKRASVYL